MTITVSVDAAGNVSASHETQFEPALAEMQGAMAPDEKQKAVALRREVCRTAAEFFLFVRDPDRPHQAAG